ncbi:MetQ/NlpA family ABC transporter substrate-binding protein [Pseudomonas sp. NC26]|uniref:MetQ/NlpA family ABC transporter substrate-binding protein n=1 Tax=Pseudomonas putida TaxID=303 RepID=A0A7W2KYP9_PSEPU|nr:MULTISPECIES: MetQ/NlpA family ABC transporter substrate-binding protein [Pseudomonas]MBA6115132.1 MetQ/NlpA family ABC transporter substrate-binding protein [Pseudomonas putida]MCZ9639315.1 MetQ/NlpA family ABC transporter substrate-binding protein [Pseudomonas putida]MEC4874741.1 MetQ/NlpA family ABC transporter substrate-binding protein [Pseudomonas sp. NC26]QNL88625.1 Methionine ABC transporter substrate-binding protein [Pseudomonas putida]
MMTRRTLGMLALATSIGALTISGFTVAEEQTLKIGLAASPANEAVRYAAQVAETKGLHVKLYEFTDWVTPNSALNNGDVDVNYFQHVPFLENAQKANGWKFSAVAPGYISWLGAYTEKLKSLDDLKDGAKISFANDPVNTGRALLFLQSLGLVKLKPGASYGATLQDVVENPKQLQFIQVEAQQVVRSLPDVDVGLTFASFIKLAGKDPADALVFEKPDNLYAIHWVARADHARDPRIAEFINIYDTAPEVKKILTDLYNGQVGFAW